MELSDQLPTTYNNFKVYKKINIYIHICIHYRRVKIKKIFTYTILVMPFNVLHSNRPRSVILFNMLSL